MLLRHPKAPFPAIVATLLCLAAPNPSSGPRTPRAAVIQEAKRFAWLNNWTEASRVLGRLGSLPSAADEEGVRVFSQAAHIRGNIEGGSLPSAAEKIAALLATNAAQRDSELHFLLLSIKGDVEFQFDLRACEISWKEAREVASRAGQSVWAARADGELGAIAFLNGDVFEATKLVTGAVLKAELFGDIAAQIRYRTTLGEGFAEYGRTADAIHFFDKALALSASAPDAYFPFTAYLGKARLLATSGRAQEGLGMLRTGLDEARRKGLKVREARILTVLGELASANQNHDEAISWLMEAAEVAAEAGLDRVEADATSALASLLQQLGKSDQASSYARQSVSAGQRAGDLYHLPQLMAVLGEIEAARGNLKEAEAQYARATDLVDGLLRGFPHPRNKNILVSTMGRVFQGHFDLAIEKMKDPAKAFAVLESARARGLVETIRDAGTAQRHSPVDAALAPQIAAVNRDLSREEDVEQRSRLLERLWELEMRSLTPRRLGSDAQGLTVRQPVSLQELQSRLAEDEALVEYALTPTRAVAFLVDRRQVRHYALKNGEDLNRAVEKHLVAIREKRDARMESKLLYQLLVEPIALANHYKRLVIVPDGKLHLVAFDTLMDQQNRLLLDAFVISYAPSATAYYLLTQPRVTPRNQTALLAVGGARYPARGLKDVPTQRGLGMFDPSRAPEWAAIPESLTEVQDIAALHPGSAMVLTGDDANEMRFKRLDLSVFRMLHLALHSTIDEEFPDRSALVLSSRRQGNEDDLLQAREIVGLNLNADLVTLSACDAGAGRLEGVAGMNSLVQAFLMAGSRSVVASIWAVDDAFTAALMRRFYGNLQHGFDKAEALTLAKREMLRTYGPNALPFYWAGFRLIGESHGKIPGG
jgi:CHAT domain-containing protein